MAKESGLKAFFSSLFHRSARPVMRQARSSPRLVMSEPVHLKIGDTVRPGTLENLSATGAAIHTTERLRPGDAAILLMNFGLYKFELHARVVYARPEAQGYHTRYGLRFVAITPEEAERITAFVNEQKYGRQAGVHAFSRPTEPE